MIFNIYLLFHGKINPCIFSLSHGVLHIENNYDVIINNRPPTQVLSALSINQSINQKQFVTRR